MEEKFSPNIETAKLCVHAIKIATNQIGTFKDSNSKN